MPDDGRRYARSLPPEAIDLSPLPSVPRGGWPLDLTDLAPFHARAQRLWNGAPFDYDPTHWPSETGDLPAWTFPGIETRLAQHGPGDVFSTRYRDDLLLAENVDVLVGTTVRQITAGPSGDTVTTVEAVTDRGEAVSVRAKAFVLAGGGVENASLLLQSPWGAPGGAANPHDVVGGSSRIIPSSMSGPSNCRQRSASSNSRTTICAGPEQRSSADSSRSPNR